MKCRSAAFVISIFVATAQGADERPLIGLAYNTKEWSSLFYDCSSPRNGELECEFTQVGVRKKVDGADLAKKLKGLETEELEEIDAERCSEAKKIVDALEGRTTPPKGMELPATELEKRDVLNMTRIFVDYCKAPSKELVAQLVRLGHEQEMHTCLVRSHHFKQRFTLVADTRTGKRSWVVQSSPQGSCGTVQLDHFEPVTPFDGKLTFWNYVARKAVTNPEGEAFPGVKCGDLDEETYFYSWDTKYSKRPAQCEYIEFSPL